MVQYEEISFPKGGEVYCIRWLPGQENTAFEAVYGWVDNPEIDFDGLDGRIVARIINERAKEREIKGE
ncbi:MAG: hypothetical protein AABX29_07095 [Nanoarchaeota archaeon]